MQLRTLAASALMAATLAGCGQYDDSPLASQATLMALQTVGLQVVQPLPTYGCSGSAIPPEKVIELLNAIPVEQQALLAQVLNFSSPAWSVQLYSGEAGIGFCFPVENTLILMPAKSMTTTPTTTEPATVIIPPADTTTSTAG